MIGTTWKIFALRFRAQENWNDIVLDGYNFQPGVADIFMDWVGIVAAGVPLSLADITVLTTDPGSTGDLVDPGSVNTSTQTFAGEYILQNVGAGSEVSVGGGPSWTTLRSSSNLTSPANGDLLYLIEVGWERGASGGYGHVQFSIFVGSIVYATWEEYVDDNTPDGFRQILLIMGNVYQTPFHFKARVDSGVTVYVKCASYDIIQFTTHTHTISGDAHTTPVSGDSHAHSNTDPKHRH